MTARASKTRKTAFVSHRNIATGKAMWFEREGSCLSSPPHLPKESYNLFGLTAGSAGDGSVEFRVRWRDFRTLRGHWIGSQDLVGWGPLALCPCRSHGLKRSPFVEWPVFLP